MSSIRPDEIMMVQPLPKNQLYSDMREQAFELLESMRKKIPDFDYERELAEYREENYL